MDGATRQRGLRVVGSIIGLLLLLAACWAIWSQRAQLSDAWTHMRSQGARAWMLGACLILLPWVSWVLSSTMYWLLMNTQRQPRRVQFGEMLAVIGAAWLMNYLPLRPGLAGRLAYHASVNAIPLKEGVARSVLAVSCGGVGVAGLLIALLAAKAMGVQSSAQAALILGGPLVGLAATSAMLTRRDLLRRYALACVVRYLDVLSWMGRYLCAFALLGRPLSLLEAGVLTAISQAAMVVPFVSNGLGLREWAVGLLAPMLPTWVREGVTSAGTAGTPSLSKTAALAGDVLHRVGDVVAALPVGLWGAAVVARRMRARASEVGTGGTHER